MPSPAQPFGNKPSADKPVTASDKPNESAGEDDAKLAAIYEKTPEAAKKYVDDNAQFIDWGGKDKPESPKPS